MIEIFKLTVLRGSKRALDIASLKVTPGELCAVIGANGAGKSTLLKTLSGILPATSGSVLIDGEDISKLSRRSISRLVSYLPQRVEPAYPVTVYDFLVMSRYVLGDYGSDTAAAKAEEQLSRFGLGEYRNASIDALSGGELQRVLLAGTLMQEARYVLLDEPSASLDPVQEEALFKVLEEERRNGIGILVATHDLARVRKSATRIIALKQGAVVAESSPAQLDQRGFTAEVYK